MKKSKITVVKRTLNQDLIDVYLSEKFKKDGFEFCEYFKDGQEFIVDDPNVMPDKFCAWAWVDIHRELVTVMSGGNLDWMSKEGSALTCCTDGFRPVVFKIERID